MNRERLMQLRDQYGRVHPNLHPNMELFMTVYVDGKRDFNMATGQPNIDEVRKRTTTGECHTHACLAGHAVYLWGEVGQMRPEACMWSKNAGDLLGLTHEQATFLFGGYSYVSSQEIAPDWEAIARIDFLLQHPHLTEEVSLRMEFRTWWKRNHSPVK